MSISNKKTSIFITMMFLFSSMFVSISVVSKAANTYTVEVSSNIKYGTATGYDGKSQDLLFDMYSPKELKKANRPVLFLIHGGGFTGGSKIGWAGDKWYPRIASKFVSTEGFVVFSIDYRLHPAGTKDKPIYVYKETAQDVRAKAAFDAMKALNWIKAHKVEYGIDTTKIVVAGDSAGSAIAADVSFQNNNSANIAYYINLWGGMPNYSEGEANNWNGDIFPYDKLSKYIPPTLSVIGTVDPICSVSKAIELKDKIQAQGVLCVLVKLSGASHYPIERFDEITNSMIQNAKKRINSITKYTVKFNDGQAAIAPLTQEYAKNSVLEKVVPPLKSGYQFVDWYKDNTFTTKWNFASDRIVSLTTLYAKYIKVSSESSEVSSLNYSNTSKTYSSGASSSNSNGANSSAGSSNITDTSENFSITDSSTSDKTSNFEQTSPGISSPHSSKSTADDNDNSNSAQIPITIGFAILIGAALSGAILIVKKNMSR